MTRGPTWSGGISGSVPASTTSVTPPSWSRAGPYHVSWSQLLMAAPVPRSPAPGSPPRWIRRGWTIRSRLCSSFRPPQRRLHNTPRRHHPWRWRGPVTALVADPVDGSVQVPGCVDMDDDNLTRVDPDAEDRVRLVAQRPAQAVEDIGFHRFTLPFRSRPGHADRPGIEIAGRLGMNRVFGRLGPSGRGKTCRRSARRGRSGVGPPAGRGDHPRPPGGTLHGGGPAAAPPREGRAPPGMVVRTDRGGARSPANYSLSSVVSFATRRSMSSSTVPDVGRPRWPASSDSSFLVRPW